MARGQEVGRSCSKLRTRWGCRSELRARPVLERAGSLKLSDPWELGYYNSSGLRRGGKREWPCRAILKRHPSNRLPCHALVSLRSCYTRHRSTANTVDKSWAASELRLPCSRATWKSTPTKPGAFGNRTRLSNVYITQPTLQHLAADQSLSAGPFKASCLRLADPRPTSKQVPVDFSNS